MRKLISILLSIVILCSLTVPVLAITPEPVITRQPQNPVYCEYDIAEYSVTVQGENLSCSWFMSFNGRDYNISDTSGGMQPWEPYAGESYGPAKSVNGSFTTFTYTFQGIGSELNGSYIYAVIEDGHYDVTSDKAYINVVADSAPSPEIHVAPGMEIYKGEPLELYCEAYVSDGSELSYLWYETSTGKLPDIIAINRGTEDRDTLSVDTGSVGTRYYVCGVTTSAGGSAYSSVIPVTVIEKPAAAADGNDKPADDPADKPEKEESGKSEADETGKEDSSVKTEQSGSDNGNAEPNITDDTDSDDKNMDNSQEGKNEQKAGGIPFGAVLLIAVAAAGVGVAVSFAVIKKKK